MHVVEPLFLGGSNFLALFVRLLDVGMIGDAFYFGRDFGRREGGIDKTGLNRVPRPFAGA